MREPPESPDGDTVTPPDRQPERRRDDANGRLESWKEIAAFLGRSVLTAQRWEKTEGLPVHRHAHEKQASVYAYREELDAWRAARSGAVATAVDAPASPPSTSLRTLVRRRAVRVCGVVALLGAVTGAVAWQTRVRNERWARRALPAIERLVRSNLTSEARFQVYRMAVDAEPYLVDDADRRRLWGSIFHPVVIVTQPPGAEVFVSSQAGSDTLDFVVADATLVRVPRASLRWWARKDGYEPAGGILNAFGDTLRIVFDRLGTVPPGMVRASAGTFPMDFTHLGERPDFRVGDYWIDRFEVTNREYQGFVDVGGYANPEYWHEKFFKDGRTLSFAEAMRLFRDRTGQPGPAMWTGGSFPEGQSEYPVTGVSWFEAMAFARYSGKSLPSIYHWARAAGVRANAEIVPRSNFAGAGPAPVGRHAGVSAVGALDMAGNAKEWCFNGSAHDRFILGGAWSEPHYMFTEADAQSPFARAETFGLRLVKYITPPESALFGDVDYPRRDFTKERPVSDAVFTVIRGLYSYDKSRLHASVDSVDDTNEHWRRERISFDAAYGGERVTAYLFLPRHVAPPYQTVVFFPGSGDLHTSSSRAVTPPWSGSAITSGRALVYPVFKSTFERRDSLASDYPVRTDFYREHVLDWHKDLERTLDYLETRRDFDSSRVAYLGFSWGARLAPIFLALDARLKTAVLVSGGLKFAETFPEVDPFNFASRVTVPVLMLNGRYDYFFPLETSQQPLLRLLGTADRDKRHIIMESGHAPPPTPVVKETLEWLDRYLGTVVRVP